MHCNENLIDISFSYFVRLHHRWEIHQWYFRRVNEYPEHNHDKWDLKANVRDLCRKCCRRLLDSSVELESNCSSITGGSYWQLTCSEKSRNSIDEKNRNELIEMQNTWIISDQNEVHEDIELCHVVYSHDNNERENNRADRGIFQFEYRLNWLIFDDDEYQELCRKVVYWISVFDRLFLDTANKFHERMLHYLKNDITCCSLVLRFMNMK